MATTSSVPYPRRELEPAYERGFPDRLVATSSSLAPTIARLALGLVMFPHGAQKMLGWFGGAGWSGTMHALTSSGLPAPLAALVILGEFFGSIMLILGLFTRLGALTIALIMLGAIATVHAKVGFFMNWFGTMKGEGFEYHLLALGLALSLLIAGGGAGSADRAMLHRRTVR